MPVSKSEDNLQDPVCPYTLQLPGIKPKSSHLVTRAWTTEPPLWPVDSMAKCFWSLVNHGLFCSPLFCGNMQNSPCAEEVGSLPRGDEVTGPGTKGDGLSKQTWAKTTQKSVYIEIVQRDGRIYPQVTGPSPAAPEYMSRPRCMAVSTLVRGEGPRGSCHWVSPLTPKP